jgi:putative membrane protein
MSAAEILEPVSRHLPELPRCLLARRGILGGGAGGRLARSTPHSELTLLRAGNLPCALAFGGKALGMVLPIAAVARAAAGPLDQIIWCIVAVAVQLVVHVILTLLLEGRLKEEIAADRLGGAAVFIAFMQVGAGVLNNAVMLG